MRTVAGNRGRAARSAAWLGDGELEVLRAALFHDRRALDSWARVRDDAGSLERAARLLPLVATNLERLNDPAAVALRNHARAVWAENMWLIEAVAPVLLGLQSAGLAPVLLKGIALATSVYPSLQLRRIGDVDVLIGPAGLPAAREALEAAGFREMSPMPPGAVPYLHSFGYHRDDGVEVDLHAYALMECCWPGVDDELRARATSADLLGRSMRVPAPEDQLLIACVHGLRWSARPTVHWAADAVTILERSVAELSWPIVVEAARQRGVVVPLHRALDFLRCRLEAPIPDDVLRALGDPRPLLRHRLEAAARMRPPSLWRGLFVHWCTLARVQPTTSAWRRLARFPGYLREVWGLPSLWSVPLAAARRSAARLRART